MIWNESTWGEGESHWPREVFGDGTDNGLGSKGHTNESVHENVCS